MQALQAEEIKERRPDSEFPQVSLTRELVVHPDYSISIRSSSRQFFPEKLFRLPMGLVIP